MLNVSILDIVESPKDLNNMVSICKAPSTNEKIGSAVGEPVSGFLLGAGGALGYSI